MVRGAPQKLCDYVECGGHGRAAQDHMWGFPKIRGTLFGGPYNKDCSISGSILGSA